MDMTNTKPFQITITSFLHCDSAVDDYHMAWCNPNWLLDQNKKIIPTES